MKMDHYYDLCTASLITEFRNLHRPNNMLLHLINVQFYMWVFKEYQV